jgi:hypothetical protein
MIVDHIGSNDWPRRLHQTSLGKRFLLAAVATVGVTAVASSPAESGPNVSCTSAEPIDRLIRGTA